MIFGLQRQVILDNQIDSSAGACHFAAEIGLINMSFALHPQIVRGLNDKLYEKRKSAALEIEK